MDAPIFTRWTASPYFLLTGKLVFEAEHGLQAIMKHLNEPPVPPSRRAGIAVPEGLESVVLACLQKRPGDRPRSALHLQRRLEAIQLDRWSPDDAEQWWASRTAN